MAVFWRAIKAYHDRTGDENIPKLLEKHYLSYPAEELDKWRNIVSIEGMLWTYDKTGKTLIIPLNDAAANLISKKGEGQVFKGFQGSYIPWPQAYIRHDCSCPWNRYLCT